MSKHTYHAIGENIFHINKITKVWTSKRLFCIKERDKPYNLIIKYNQPMTDISPLGISILKLLDIDDKQIHVFRFASEYEARQHKNEIIDKKWHL